MISFNLFNLDVRKGSVKSINKFFLLTLLLAVINGCKTTQESTKSPNIKEREVFFANLDKALGNMDKENYEDAEKQLKALLETNPSSEQVRANLGLLFFIRKDYDTSERYLEPLAKSDTKMSQAFNLLGLISQHKQQFIKAKDFYERALEIAPKYSNAHYNLALLYEVYLQDNSKAAHHYREYLDSIPNEDKITLEWLTGIESVLAESKGG